MNKLNLITAAVLLSASGMVMADASDQGCESSGGQAAGCSDGEPIVVVGPAGPQGEQGEPGMDGKDGQDGQQGPKGDRGPRGYDGQDGKDGQSYDPEFISDLNARIAENEERINSAVAASYAVSSHQFDVHGDLQLSVSGGYYQGESAASVAVGGAVSETVFINGNLTQDSQGNTGAGVGVTFQLQ